MCSKVVMVGAAVSMPTFICKRNVGKLADLLLRSETSAKSRPSVSRNSGQASLQAWLRARRLATSAARTSRTSWRPPPALWPAWPSPRDSGHPEPLAQVPVSVLVVR